jgi:hypothetical protein
VAEVVVEVVVEVDTCAVSAVLELFGAAAAAGLFAEAALGGISLTGVEGGVAGIFGSAAAGGASTPAVAVAGSAAAWPELSDEAGEADGVDVVVCAESVELGLSGPVPETVVVVTLGSAVGGSADPLVVDGVVSALAAV